MLALVPMLALAAACGGDPHVRLGERDVVADDPACVDVFAPGRPTADVVADYDAEPCRNAAGGLFVAVVMSWDCGDGTLVRIVEGYGWGRDGDVWQAADVPAPGAGC